MRKPFEARARNRLKGEISARHKQKEEQEARRPNHLIAGRVRCRRLSARPAWTLPLAIAAMLLAPGVLGAQNQPDALFIDTNGNVGIGTTTPGFPLTFPNTAGDKISLWGQTGAHYGFGIQNGLLQIYAASKDADIALGYGKSDSLTVTMRIRGDGLLHFGGATDAPKRLPSGQGAYLGWNALNGGTGETDFINNRGGGPGGFAFMNTDPAGSDDIKKSTLMVITGGGSVGIGTGTAKPRGLLDVAGEIVAVNRLTLAQDTGEEKTTWHVDNSGGLFRLSSQPNIKTTGTLALAATNTGNVGIGTETPDSDAKLDVNGNVRVRTHLYVDGFVVFKDHYGAAAKDKWVQIGTWGGNYVRWDRTDAPSDLRLKSDLQSIPSALDKIHKLRGVTYLWNADGLRYLTRDIETTLSAGPHATAEENQKLWQTERAKRYKELAKTQVGVVAQDVETVLPEAVTTDEAGYKSVRYNELIPLLIDAVKELDKKVKDQSQLVAQQRQEIARLATSNSALQQQLTELAAVKAQVARLDAAMQRVTANQHLGPPDAVASLSGSMAH